TSIRVTQCIASVLMPPGFWRITAKFSRELGFQYAIRIGRTLERCVVSISAASTDLLIQIRFIFGLSSRKTEA
ncbi:MAG: hypothetical protein P8176_16320, partial [Gammaproteobacteria bacterium]